jgi:hypothetical protein
MDSFDEEFFFQRRGPGIGQAAAEWRSLAHMAANEAAKPVSTTITRLESCIADTK